MSKIDKIKVNNVTYDIGANYNNIENTPDLTQKQDTLVSGQNIKTINNQSLLGNGNITIEGGGSGTSNYNSLSNKPKINNVELNGNKTNKDLGIQDKLISGQNIKTINNQSILGSGNINISGGEAINVGNIQFDLVEEGE